MSGHQQYKYNGTVAIHKRDGSFSDKWIEYCEMHGVDYKIVDCHSSDIISDLTGCSALLWHWAHNNYRDMLLGRCLIQSLGKTDIAVFPDAATSWHYDDKIAQKYLFESLNIPSIPTDVHYSAETAMAAAEDYEYPVVFKLRSGAGSINVKLLNTIHEARSAIKKSFKGGYRYSPKERFYEKLSTLKRTRRISDFYSAIASLARFASPHPSLSKLKTEKNYFLTQAFIPDNNCDIRVIVIGDKAFAIKRMTRDNDFRASGSGKIVHDHEQIPIECVEAAFKYSIKIGGQCIAYDFIFSGNTPLVVEISYCFNRNVYTDCPGHWNSNLQWVKGKFTPEFFIIEDLLRA